jgi:putative glutathione S-transferase
MVVSRVSSRTALDEVDSNGDFKRVDAAWRNWISSKEGAEFPPEKDRYHLFVSYACPWAHRTLIVRALKGLEDVISVTVVHPTWQATKPGVGTGHTGWVFGNPDAEPFSNTAGRGGPFDASLPDTEPDPIYNSYSIRELYERAGDTNGKYSVPILWDKKKATIVSNESSEIIRMFNNEFNDFAKNPKLDLYPQDLRTSIDNVNKWVYPTINNGVYRCGFAASQQAYDKAIDELTESFDRIEEILQKQKFIAGDSVTEADIRLFVTLVRFDPVYIVYFKCNTRSVAASPAILDYCRRVYQMPGVADTVNMRHIKQHYFTSHPNLNHYSIIPRGTDFEALLKEPVNGKK